MALTKVGGDNLDFQNGSSESIVKITTAGAAGSGTLDLQSEGDVDVPVTGLSNLTGSGTSLFPLHTNGSDARIKKHVKTISPNHGHGIILSTRPVTYHLKKDNRKDSGVIAQEAEKILPHAVHQCKNEGLDDYRSVSYPSYIPYLIASHQQLHARVQQLEQQLSQLSSQKSPQNPRKRKKTTNHTNPKNEPKIPKIP